MGQKGGLALPELQSHEQFLFTQVYSCIYLSSILGTSVKPTINLLITEWVFVYRAIWVPFSLLFFCLQLVMLLYDRIRLLKLGL